MKAVHNNIQDQHLKIAADRLTGRLQEVVGPTADLLTATWSEEKDSSNRPRLKVELKEDWSGLSATTLFAPDELSKDQNVRERFYVLWGDFLQGRSDRLIRGLQSSTVSQD